MFAYLMFRGRGKGKGSDDTSLDFMQSAAPHFFGILFGMVLLLCNV